MAPYPVSTPMIMPWAAVAALHRSIEIPGYPYAILIDYLHNPARGSYTW